MRDRRRPLNVPHGFTPIAGMPDHYLMRPRADIVARVLQTFVEGSSSALQKSAAGTLEASNMDVYAVAAGAVVFGLAIGFLLFHPQRQLEIRPDDVGDDREAGRMVYAELQAAQYSDDDIRALGEAAFSAILNERMNTPTREEIEARAGNGAAPA